jgi:precorrin-6B methylase 2
MPQTIDIPVKRPFRVADVLADMPAIHGSGTFGLEPVVIAEFQKRISPGMHTLETGCGLSTLLFALGGSDHTVITPSEDELSRLRDYCRPRGIDLDRVTMVAQPSHLVLPSQTPESFDMIFIDGCHGIPMVQVDYLFSALALKPGGTLVLDDVQLSPVLDLLRFLKRESSWRFDATHGKTAFLTKLRSGDETLDWYQQPYVVEQTARIPNNWRILHHLRRMKHAGQMLVRGDFKTLGGKLLR